MPKFYRLTRSIVARTALCATLATAAIAQEGGQMIDDFSGTPQTRWEFISDQVMGGVSTGQVTLRPENGQTVLHLAGSVSTANKGGFIQARLKLPDRLSKDAEGLEVKVKGNGQTYYIHARTSGTVLPWNFYQAPFDTTEDWQVLRIPFQQFEAQGVLLRNTLAADAVKSVAVVAFGRDHTADVSVASIAFY